MPSPHPYSERLESARVRLDSWKKGQLSQASEAIPQNETRPPGEKSVSRCVPSPLGISGVTFQGPFSAPGLTKGKPVPLLSSEKTIFSMGGSALGV